MSNRVQILENVQDYAKKAKETEYYASSDIGSHGARLEQTLKGLNARIERERAALEDLKKHNVGPDILEEDSVDPRVQLHQQQIITNAYTSLTPTEPDFPSPGSALPALLALRTTQSLISETAASIPATHTALQDARSRLAKEQADVSDAALLTQALGDRIESLRVATTEKSQKSPDKAARALIEAELVRKKAYDRQTKQTMRALVKFTNTTLAPMLAAEELGGPVAGSILEITDDMLAAGFNAQGKPKRSKVAVSEDKRQRRIDQIWGPQGEDGGEFEEQPRSEAEAAAEEMKALVEELLNAVTEGGTGAWVRLGRESAAARFLVRAGIAVLQRTDARKIRLVDFGREVDS